MTSQNLPLPKMVANLALADIMLDTDRQDLGFNTVPHEIRTYKTQIQNPWGGGSPLVVTYRMTY